MQSHSCWHFHEFPFWTWATSQRTVGRFLQTLWIFTWYLQLTKISAKTVSTEVEINFINKRNKLLIWWLISTQFSTFFLHVTDHGTCDYSIITARYVPKLLFIVKTVTTYNLKHCLKGYNYSGSSHADPF